LTASCGADQPLLCRIEGVSTALGSSPSSPVTGKRKAVGDRRQHSLLLRLLHRFAELRRKATARTGRDFPIIVT
jgi:hypothetical protein